MLMKCPKCGSDQHCVLDVKKSCTNTHRKRKCNACGYIFYTYERAVADASGYLQALKRFNKERYKNASN